MEVSQTSISLSGNTPVSLDKFINEIDCGTILELFYLQGILPTVICTQKTNTKKIKHTLIATLKTVLCAF